MQILKKNVYALNNTFLLRHIITSNVNGDIIFYDASLRMLYHLNKFVGHFITSIGMVNVDHTSKDKGTFCILNVHFKDF